MRPRISTSRDGASRYEGVSAFSSRAARTATISPIHRYSTGRYYIPVGSEGDDRTGVYDIRVIGRLVE